MNYKTIAKQRMNLLENIEKMLNVDIELEQSEWYDETVSSLQKIEMDLLESHKSLLSAIIKEETDRELYEDEIAEEEFVFDNSEAKKDYVRRTAIVRSYDPHWNPDDHINYVLNDLFDIDGNRIPSEERVGGMILLNSRLYNIIIEEIRLGKITW